MDATIAKTPDFFRKIPPRQSLNEKYDLVHLGEIEAQQPAFLTLTDSPDGTTDLYVSGFSVLGGGTVSSLHNVADKLASKQPMRTRLMTEKIDWPNEIAPEPLSEAGDEGRRMFAVPSGFLVPGRNTGGVYIMSTNEANPENGDTFATVKITKDKPGWFYHRAEWADVNGDGKADLITARAQLTLTGKSDGEMVWLEQPENPMAGPWKEHPLSSIGDVHFRMADLNRDGEDEIVATEFFGKRVVYGGPEGITTIDDKLGSPFDLQVVDLDGDGRLEVLASNHEKGSGGKVVAYIPPQDLGSDQPWERRPILENIKASALGINSAAPGQALAFPMGDEDKPWILVSGDGSGKAHLLEPMGDWKYQEHVILDVGSTVGQSAVADVNKDGLPELFVPAYDRGKIHVFSVVPKVQS